MSKKVIIIIIAVAMLFMVVTGTGFFLLWTKMSANLNGNNTDQEEAAQKKEEEQIKGTYKLETFIVNLAGKGGKRFLRVTMVLEMDNEALKDEIDKRLSQVRDRILMIIPSKKYEDINSTAGKIMLRDEIINDLNRTLKKGRITNLFFTEFIIQ